MANEKKEDNEVTELLMQTFAKLTKRPLFDLTKNQQAPTALQRFSKEKILSLLENPSKNVKELRDASIYMYNSSNHYRRLINYFAKMPTFAYTIAPYKFDANKVKNDNFTKQYTKVCSIVENMQIKHEFYKILTVAFREDVFFGLVWETTDSFSIQKMNPDNCILSSIEDGVYNFAYDMSKIKETDLLLYPPEFSTMYSDYKNGGAKWQEVPSKISIVIKVNEDITFPLPVFVGVLPALYDIEDFKYLMKQRTEVGNYKALGLQIPMDKDGELLISWEKALKYYNQLLSVLPEGIGATISPMKIESIDFEKGGNLSDSDEVSKSEEQFWSNAGISSLLFGSRKNTSSSALKLSIKADEELVFAVLAQIERWINRRLKAVSGTIKFKINMLPITVFNQDEMIKSYTTTSTYGVPVKSYLCGTLGLSPSDISGMTYLENEILKIPETFVPLSSSHTATSTTGAVGRPTNESKGEDLTDAGEATKEDDAGDNK